jgi:hypothetical protein
MIFIEETGTYFPGQRKGVPSTALRKCAFQVFARVIRITIEAEFPEVWQY